MSELSHQVLWQRVQTALKDHGAWPEGHPTSMEAGRHVQNALGTDLVLRFVTTYYQGKLYGSHEGVIDDGAAEKMVIEIEQLARSWPVQSSVLKRTPGTNPIPSNQDGSDFDPIQQTTAALPAPLGRTHIVTDTEEAVAYGPAEGKEESQLYQVDGQPTRYTGPVKELTTKQREQGLDRYEQDDYRGAIPLLTEALELQPDDAPTWHILGFCHGQIGNQDQAITCYREALAIDPQRKTTLANLGYRLRLKKQFVQAAKACESALKIDPRYGLAWQHLGFIRKDQNDYGAALAAFLWASKIEPKDADNWFWMGWCHSKLRQHEQSMQAYQKACELEPADPMHWSNLGHKYLILLRFDEAESAFRAALARKEAHASAWRGLADVLDHRGQEKDANIARKRASGIDSRNASIAKRSMLLLQSGWRLTKKVGRGLVMLWIILIVAGVIISAGMALMRRLAESGPPPSL